MLLYMTAPPHSFTLPDWEDEVRLWFEPSGAIHLVAHTRDHHDPVELTALDARRLARALEVAAAAADELDG